MSAKKIDLIVVIMLPILAAIITVFFQTNILISVLLFIGVPPIYLSFRNPGIFSKSTIFALLFSIPLSLFVDTLAAINGAWVVPTTIFPFRILGISTVEVYLYGLLWVFYAVTFYEHFFDRGAKGDRLSHNTKYLMYLFIVLALSVVTILHYHAPWLHIPYFYFILGTIFTVIPLVLFLSLYPRFTKRFMALACYFFALMFTFEIAALAAKQWIFPGQFLFFINFFGYKFPFEEFFFWMIVATPALMAYYEFFVDDRGLGPQS